MILFPVFPTIKDSTIPLQAALRKRVASWKIHYGKRLMDLPQFLFGLCFL